MKTLSALTADEARALRGLVFDLDGTLLTNGQLGLAAYRALFALRDSGLLLCASTGRPAAWGSVVARQWPIDLAVTENGAVFFVRTGRNVVAYEALDESERRRRREHLDRIVADLAARFPDVPITKCNVERRTDVTFDVGELVVIPRERIDELHRAAREAGARTLESSIHLHVTLDACDKASGTLSALSHRFGIDRTAALSRFAFVGDSANDDSCFAAFRLTFGVANVRRSLGSLTIPPRFVASAEQGEGFVEIAERLVRLREGR